jgi:hypothetical protein
LFAEGVLMNGNKRWLLVLALFLLATPARASEVQGFTVNKIDGVGDLEGQLDERLTENYVVSYSDCLYYLEGYVASETPTTACDSDLDCNASDGVNACSSLGGVRGCVECARDSDCLTAGDGNVLCDLATRTCAEEPMPGDCAVDADCDAGVCVLWGGSNVCLPCATNDDCDVEEWCEFSDSGTACVTDAQGLGCEACPDTCYFDDDMGFLCGQCAADSHCLDPQVGLTCDFKTHLCGEADAIGECTVDADCPSGSCVLWGEAFKCVPCVIDANCGVSTPVCLASGETTACVECVEDADCLDNGDGYVCNTDTAQCEKETGTSIAASPKILVRFSVDSISYPGGDYAVKVGTACSESGDGMLDSEASDSCTTIVSRRAFDGSYTNIEVTVPVSDILGDECVNGDDGTTSIYFYASVDDGFSVIDELSKVEIHYDYDPPLPPQNVTVEAGEGNLKVSWDDDSNNEEVEYRVYWAAYSFDESTVDKAFSKGGLSAKTYQIDDLENGATYFVAVTAVDTADNESELSTVLEETPVSVDDFWEYYQQNGGGEAGGFCFVATAAYGSPMDLSVGMLRVFRDRVLLASAWGRSLVNWYYINGPIGANFIRDSEGLRLAARIVLTPAVFVAWMSVGENVAARFAVSLMLMGLAMLLWRRRLVAQRRVS